jgi:hypothetical protein
MRNVMIRLGMWTVGLGSVAAVACSAPDPGVGYLGPSPSPAASVGPSEDAGAPPVDSGLGTGIPDTGVDSAPAAVDASFLGENAPYSSASLPTKTAQGSHAAAGQPIQSPITDCLSCHVTGNPAAPPFLAAGYVARTLGPDGGGAAGVEVRVYAGGGVNAAGYSTYTDTNGYFWINPPVTTTSGPYTAGARNATLTQIMTAAASLDCQTAGCHAGAQGSILMP